MSLRLILLAFSAIVSLATTCSDGIPPPAPVRASCSAYSASDCATAAPTSGKKCVAFGGTCRDLPDIKANCADYLASDCEIATPVSGKICAAIGNICLETTSPGPLPDIGGEPDDCRPTPITPHEPIKDVEQPATLDAIEARLLESSQQLAGVINEAALTRRTEETIRLLTLVAKIEPAIMNQATASYNSYGAGAVSDNFLFGLSNYIATQMNISGFVIPGNNAPPMFDSAILAGFPPNLPPNFSDIEPFITTQIREGASYLAQADALLQKSPQLKRHFFMAAFDKEFGCVAARNRQLQAWVETVIKNKPHSDIVYGILIEYSDNARFNINADPSKEPPSFTYDWRRYLQWEKRSNIARIVAYYFNNIVLKPLFENAKFQDAPLSDIRSSEEYADAVNLDKAVQWVFDNVKKGYDDKKKTALWQGSKFADRNAIRQELDATYLFVE